MIIDLEEIRRTLEPLSTPERAINEKRYLKSDLEFIGVPVPAIRKVAQRLSRELEEGGARIVDRRRRAPVG